MQSNTMIETKVAQQLGEKKTELITAKTEIDDLKVQLEVTIFGFFFS